jgi:two-component system chemotaxis sensor kinase CheA
MNEILREFLLESHESLAQLDIDLVTLEKEPKERETLARAFRTVHTVKGSAGFLGFSKLQAVSHAAESLLSRLRAGELVFNPDIASTLLGVVDAIRRMLASVEETENEGEGDYSALIQTLDQLKSTGSLAPATVPGVPPRLPASTVRPQATRARDGSPPPAAPADSPKEDLRGAKGDHDGSPPSAAPADFPGEDLRGAKGDYGGEDLRGAKGDHGGSAPPAAAADPPSGSSVVLSPVPAEVHAAEPAEPRTPAVSDTAIRVDVGLLDKLMTLVGELVLARNQIMQFSTSQEDASFLGTVQRLNLLTTELQVNVMKTRMQPIGNIWNKFPRVVRDLAIACGKQARIELEGRETELDKTIIEAIRDPLTHLLRNAIDHGMEPPEERLARGKPAEGRVSLHAFHEGGKVIIEIADDGKGIDPQRIREKAIQAKLITPEQADRLGERELINLVFRPGFSTADRVTNFSGRGVGMDVVRTNIEKIGGTVDIVSRPERGTAIKMKIPLTLAIIPALTVTVGGDRYAIPQVSLLELVRLEGEQALRGIEQIHGAPVYRLRGSLLPLVYLSQELQVESAGTDNGAINIVVLQADDRQFGLVVDSIHDTEEIVVKPLQKQLKGIRTFSGATIMGDGKVALILDVLGLAQKAHVISGARERALSEKAATAPEPAGDRQTVLLFVTRDGGRLAIPLSQVDRLEEFPGAALERAGTQDVVQYRGEILPLIDVARVLRRRRRDARNAPAAGRREAARPREAGGDESVQVVVYSGAGRRVGLVVGQILDIVEETLASRSRSSRPGVLFTAVVQGRVTEFLDVKGIIRAADPEFFEEPQPVAAEA